VTEATDSEARVLIFTHKHRDAELSERLLKKAGVACEVCLDVGDLCVRIKEGVGAILTTAEALDADAGRTLARALNEQPPWSEVPVMVFAASGRVERTYEQLGPRAQVLVLDRPVHVQSLVSTAQAALRSRARQYEIRGLLESVEQRVQERDRFLAILGHELRNPISAILLASQMLDNNGTLSAEHARLIERQSRHLTRLVNDLLDLSRVVSGKIVLKRQIIDVKKIATQALETLGESIRAQNLDVQIKDGEGPMMIFADPVRIDQILTNLLTNSIKYTPEGGSVTVRLHTEGSDVIIEVEDTGVGIAADRIDTIFELFAQAENAIGRSRGGMGIGLALVQNLVRLHGGTVIPHSDGEGKGSRFTVRLPLASAEESVMAPVVDERRVERGAGRRIVIVEDNADIRELLKLKLRRLGHDVEVASDGERGVEKVLELQPDLALVDIGLPGIDGYEVAARVRAAGAGAVLVAVSGFGQPEDKRKALEAGFDEHLTKPADVKELEAIIASLPPAEQNEAAS
jgi:signal transduction histidine kinase/ActR/RegA family two-component response regulator